jgi:hypothetical protein
MESDTERLASMLANHALSLDNAGVSDYEGFCGCGKRFRHCATRHALELEWANHVAETIMRPEHPIYTRDYVAPNVSMAKVYPTR